MHLKTGKQALKEKVVLSPRNDVFYFETRENAFPFHFYTQRVVSGIKSAQKEPRAKH